jgi:hypothetical protein
MSRITPRAILSYPFLAKPQQDQKGKMKYSCALVFPKGTDLSGLLADAIEAAEAKFGKVMKVKAGKETKEYTMAQALEMGLLRSPFRTDAEKKGYPEGSIFINVRTEKRPGVVYAHKDAATGKPAEVPADKVEDELYPGCFARASVVAFAYDTEGNKGVSFALNNVQKLGEGERLDSRQAAEDEFTAELGEALDDLDSLK